MISRRKFLQAGALAASQFVLQIGFQAAQTTAKAQNGGPEKAGPLVPHPRLDPTLIPKYADPLVIPPAMPRHSVVTGTLGEPVDYYEIGMTQFTQQILPAGGATAFNPTTVWSYYALGHPQTKNYPAFTIETRVNRPLRVK